MAINWKPGRTTDWKGATRPTWDGLVMSVWVRPNEQLMSDVWADASYASVWDPETQQIRDVRLGDGEFGMDATVEIDASPDALAAAAAYREKQRLLAEKQAAAEREERAREAALKVKMGSTVEVIRKGRSGVAVGTTGVVFWRGSNGWGGMRLGAKTPDGEVFWVPEGSVRVVIPGVPPGTSPEGGWFAWLEAENRRQREAFAARPVRGDRARLLKTGALMTVFWTNGERVGMKLDPRDRYEEPVWATVAEVERVA